VRFWRVGEWSGFRASAFFFLLSEQSRKVTDTTIDVHREWALLFPAWIVILVAFVYSSYFFLNMFNTPPFTSVSLLVGGASLPSSSLSSGTDFPRLQTLQAKPSSLPLFPAAFPMAV
jgi:hypothetical protein